jgi:hypothetical protein
MDSVVKEELEIRDQRLEQPKEEKQGVVAKGSSPHRKAKGSKARRDVPQFVKLRRNKLPTCSTENNRREGSFEKKRD